MPLNLAYSFSRISDYDCKRRFAKKYIEKKKEPQTVIAAIGNLCHDVLAYYLKRLYSKGIEKDLNALEKLIEKVLNDKSRRNQWPEHFSKDNISMIENSVQDLFRDNDIFEINPNISLYKVESHMAFDENWHLLPEEAWYHTKGIYFRAILDWAYIPENENTLWIIDHKIGWGEPNEDQLKYYALAAFAGISHEVERIGIKYHWLAQDCRIEDKGFFVPEDILNIRSDINAKINEIENNEDWETATPGKYCDYCGFTEDCPKTKEAMAVVTSDEGFQLTSKETAEKYFEMFLMAKGRLNEIEKALEQYVKKNGPIIAAGKIMESRPKTSWALEDSYGLQKALFKIGIHPTDILKSTGISERSLKKLLKDNSLVRHLEALKNKHGKEEKSEGDIKVYVVK